MASRRNRPWWEDPSAKAWLREAQDRLVPMMEESRIVMSLYTGGADAKMAVETGFAVLLDKPIIAAVTPGCTAPRKLIAVADEIIEVDLTSPEASERSQRRMMEAMRRLGIEGSP